VIVVKIELWPHGVEHFAKEIGRMYIGNVGGTDERGDYEVAVCRRGIQSCPWPHGYDDDDTKKRPQPARIGEVKNYPRLSYSVWRLVMRALKSAFPEERK